MSAAPFLIDACQALHENIPIAGFAPAPVSVAGVFYCIDRTSQRGPVRRGAETKPDVLRKQAWPVERFGAVTIHANTGSRIHGSP